MSNSGTTIAKLYMKYEFYPLWLISFINIPHFSNKRCDTVLCINCIWMLFHISILNLVCIFHIGRIDHCWLKPCCICNNILCPLSFPTLCSVFFYQCQLHTFCSMAIKYSFYTEAECGSLEDVDMGGLPSLVLCIWLFAIWTMSPGTRSYLIYDVDVLLRTSVNVLLSLIFVITRTNIFYLWKSHSSWSTIKPLLTGVLKEYANNRI